MRHVLLTLISCAALAFPFAAETSAEQVLATSYNNGSGAIYTATAYIEFTLNQTSTISSVDASLNTSPIGGAPSLSALSMEIVNNSGGSPGAPGFPGYTLYGTSATPTGTLSTSSSDINFGFSGTTLSAGTYWLELSDSNGADPIFWQAQTAGFSDVSATGSINQGFYYSQGTTRYYDGDTTLLTAINGSIFAPAAVPEPSSLLMCGLGGVGIAAFAARRRRQAVTNRV